MMMFGIQFSFLLLLLFLILFTIPFGFVLKIQQEISMNLTNIELRIEKGIRSIISRRVADITSRLAKNYMFYGANNIRIFEIGMYSVRRSIRNFTWKQYESN